MFCVRRTGGSRPFCFQLIKTKEVKAGIATCRLVAKKANANFFYASQILNTPRREFFNPSLFNSLKADIISKKYDFIFIHTLVPHRPYGFDAECNYDGSLSLTNRFFSVPKMVKQQSLNKRPIFYNVDFGSPKAQKN